MTAWIAAVGLCLVGLLAVALVLAPLKLYDLDRAAKRQNEDMRVVIKLLASIANKMEQCPPVDGGQPKPAPARQAPEE